jgi:hypothetical protein
LFEGYVLGEAGTGTGVSVVLLGLVLGFAKKFSHRWVVVRFSSEK